MNEAEKSTEDLVHKAAKVVNRAAKLAHSQTSSPPSFSGRGKLLLEGETSGEVNKC